MLDRGREDSRIRDRWEPLLAPRGLMLTSRRGVPCWVRPMHGAGHVVVAGVTDM